ncbi:MAG: hypothetical protein JJU00_03670 [Opitutales bacterium]|nr:hypothetical protein [Opitutales bacterium]
MQTDELSLSVIDIHGGTQSRAATNDDAVGSYADEMEAGTVFPPVTVYFDGSKHWLADGFHRYLAAKRTGRETITAEVHGGTRTDALRHALGANAANGLFRSNADKRNAVEIALEEWPDLANPVIAELCKVSADLVRRCRTEMEKAMRIDKPGKVTGRDGKQYPAAVEREPRGVTEKPSSADQGSGGGGGGKPKGGDFSLSPGGANREIEAEARSMVRKGEIPFKELASLRSATAMDYAETAVNVLDLMPADDPKRGEAIARLERWIAKQRLTPAKPAPVSAETGKRGTDEREPDERETPETKAAETETPAEAAV